MKIFEPINNFYEGGNQPLPSFQYQTEDTKCYHCGHMTRHPVRPEFIDWESIAKDYERYATQQEIRFNQIMADLDVMYGSENPAATYFKNQWLSIINTIKAEIFKQRFGDKK